MPPMPSRLIVPVRQASSNGRYEGRWPAGDKPAVGASLSSSAASSAAATGRLSEPVAPVLAQPVISGSDVSVAFAAGTGYTTLIPQWSNDGGETWVSRPNDVTSPFSFAGMTAGSYQFRALPDGLEDFASNVVSGSVSPSGSELFIDTFSSGDLTRSTNGVSWAGGTNSDVVSRPGSVSGYALRFRYNNTVANGGNGNNPHRAERRFSLGSVRPELWLEYLIEIASNFAHNDYDVPSTADNNKWLRLWCGDKSDGNNGYASHYVKTGFSLWPNGVGPNSRIQADLGNSGGSVGAYGPSIANLITTADRGQVRSIVMHLKADTSGNPVKGSTGGNGVARIWKDGVYMGGTTTLANTPSAGSNGFDFGYIFGAANADYNNGSGLVDFHLHRIRIATSNIFGVS